MTKDGDEHMRLVYEKRYFNLTGRKEKPKQRTKKHSDTTAFFTPVN